jgi:DNA-binding beta-propeller fold protein YncE
MNILRHRRGSLGATLWLCAVTACSTDRRPLEGQCTFNGDCVEGLVCAARYCRQQCASDRDCSAGYLCVPASDSTNRVCVGPASPPLCTAASDCASADGAAATCTAQRLCSPSCTTTSECGSVNASAVCVAGSGCVVPFGDAGVAPDAGGPDGGNTDAGNTDAGGADAGNTDGGIRDAGGADDGGAGDGGSADGAAGDGAAGDGAAPADGGVLRLAVVSGDGQTAAAGAPLESVLLRLTNTAGAPAAGVRVTVTVPEGASVTPAMGMTNVSGELPIMLRLGLRPGPYSFTAAAPGAEPVTITATATGPAADTISSIINVDHSADFRGVPGPGALARLRTPTAFALAADNTLYVSDDTSHRVVALSPGGQLTVVAGTGALGSTGDLGLATAAQLAGPQGLALDPARRRLYVAERGNSHRVRVIDLATGTIDTLVGGGTAPAPGYGDSGPGRSAALLNPGALALGPDGMLYVADYSHGRIRRVDLASGTISAWLGGGGCTGALTLQNCGTEGCNVTWDAAGRAFVSGTFCGAGVTSRVAVARVDEAGLVLVAGGGTATNEGALATNVSLPAGRVGLAFDAGGNLLIALENQNRVRRVEANGRIRTVVGTGTAGMTGDGAATSAALLNGPRAVVFDAQRNLYIADRGNGAVRVAWAAGSATALGATLSAQGAAAQSALITGLTAAPFTARLVDGAGAGLTAWNVTWSGVDPGVGVYGPVTTTDATGVAEVAARGGFAAGTYRFQAVATDIHGVAFPGSPASFTVNATAPAAGTIISPVNAAHASGAVVGVPGAGTLARLDYPYGLAAAADGTLYLSDYDACRVFALSPAGQLTLVAGTGSCTFGGDGGPAIAAQISRPAGLALDGVNRRLYVAESGGVDRVRVIDLASGVIDTYAGGNTTAAAPGYGDGGPARSASFSNISQIAIGPDGMLYVPDNGRNRVRRIDPATRIITNWFSSPGSCAGATAVLYSCGSANGCGVAWSSDGTPYVSGHLCSNGSANNGGGVLRGQPGAMTRYAGGGAATATAEGLPATATNFPTDLTIAFGPGGDLYVSQVTQHRVRRITAAGGIVQNVIGDGTAGDTGDFAPATAARLRTPGLMTLMPGGHFAVADANNGAVRVIW